MKPEAETLPPPTDPRLPDLEFDPDVQRSNAEAAETRDVGRSRLEERVDDVLGFFEQVLKPGIEAIRGNAALARGDAAAASRDAAAALNVCQGLRSDVSGCTGAISELQISADVWPGLIAEVRAELKESAKQREEVRAELKKSAEQRELMAKFLNEATPFLRDLKAAFPHLWRHVVPAEERLSQVPGNNVAALRGSET